MIFLQKNWIFFWKIDFFSEKLSFLLKNWISFEIKSNFFFLSRNVIKKFQNIGKTSLNILTKHFSRPQQIASTSIQYTFSIFHPNTRMIEITLKILWNFASQPSHSALWNRSQIHTISEFSHKSVMITSRTHKQHSDKQISIK